MPDRVRHVWAAWYALTLTIGLALVGSLRLREKSSDDRILVVVGVFLLALCWWELVFWATGGRVLRWFGDDKR